MNNNLKKYNPLLHNRIKSFTEYLKLPILAKLSKISVYLLLPLLLNGCSTLLQLDLDETREKNLEQDLVLLQPISDKTINENLTLMDAILFGLENNLELRLAIFEELIASKQAYSRMFEMLPDFNVRFTRNKTDELRIVNSFNAVTGDIQLNDNVSELEHRRRRQYVAVWNLLDFGLSFVRSKAASMQIQVREMQRQRRSQELALDITRNYLQAKLAEDLVLEMEKVLAELKLKQSQINQAMAQRRLDPITGRDTESRLIEFAIELQQQNDIVGSSRLELSRLLGLRATASNFQLAELDLNTFIQQLPHVMQINASKMEQYALLNRPDLFERDLVEKIRVEEVHEAILEYLPGLSFDYGRYYDHNPLLRFNHWYDYGIDLSWNLLNLPSGIFRYKATKHQVDFAKVERLALTMSVISQLHIAIMEYGMRFDRYHLYEQQYQTKKDLLNLSKERNQIGVLANLSYANRVLDYAVALAERNNAMIDLLVAYKRLLSTLGAAPNLWGDTALQFFEQEQFLNTDLVQVDTELMLNKAGS